MLTRLSIRSLWRIYKRTSVVAGAGGHAGPGDHAACLLQRRKGRVENSRALEQGEYEELHETTRGTAG